MATRCLDRGFALEPATIEKLKSNGCCTVKDLLQLSPLDFLAYGISLSEAQDILNKVCSKVSSLRYLGTAVGILRKSEESKRIGKVISTGLANLDNHLKGGLKSGTITDVCGAPGVGKTHFCLGLCVQLLLQYLRAASNLDIYKSDAVKPPGVIIYDTELKFDPKRLQDMLSSRLTIDDTYDSLVLKERVDQLLALVKIKRPTSCKELLDSISSCQETVISDNIQLIIIDSMAALARKEALNEADKEIFIIRQSSLLKRLSELCKCTVVATNHITPDYSLTHSDSCDGELSGRRTSISRRSTLLPSDVLRDRICDDAGNYRPALGSSWYHCVTSRLVLQVSSEVNSTSHYPPCSGTAISQTQGANDRFEPIKRILRLVKCPYASEFELNFWISEIGIQS